MHIFMTFMIILMFLHANNVQRGRTIVLRPTAKNSSAIPQLSETKRQRNMFAVCVNSYNDWAHLWLPHLSLIISPSRVRPPAGRPEPWTSGGSRPSHGPMSSGCHSEWSWHGRYANPLSFKLSQEAGTQRGLGPQRAEHTHTHTSDTTIYLYIYVYI